MLAPTPALSGPLRLLPPLLAAAGFRLRSPVRWCSASMAVSGPPPPAGAGAATAADSFAPSCSASSDARSLSYHRLASQLAAIEAEPSRLGKESLMRDLLCEGWAAGQEQLVACAALTTLQLEPGAKPAKLGMGTAALLEAIVYATTTARGPEALALEAGASLAADRVGPRRTKNKTSGKTAAGKAGGERAGESGATPALASRLKADLRRLGDIGLLASQELAALQENSGWAQPGAGSAGGDREAGAAGGRAAGGGRDSGETGGWEVGGVVGVGAGGGVDVLEVLLAMRAVAAAGGDGAQERKPRMLAELLRRMSPLEGKMVSGCGPICCYGGLYVVYFPHPFDLHSQPLARACPSSSSCLAALRCSTPLPLPPHTHTHSRHPAPAVALHRGYAPHWARRLVPARRLRPGRPPPRTRRRRTFDCDTAGGGLRADTAGGRYRADTAGRACDHHTAGGLCGADAAGVAWRSTPLGTDRSDG